MEKKYNHEESLRQRNELTKLKLQAEYGGRFDHGSELDPLIENIFLNNVLEFEKTMAESRQVTVREFLGNPDFIFYDNLEDEQLESALNDIMTALNKRNIFVDSICGVTDRDMYSFLTKELLETETESILPKGMTKYFIYEEFHPNHEYDLRLIANNFIENLSDLSTDFNETFGYDGEAKQKIILRKINEFRNTIDEIIVDEFLISEITINDRQAVAQFTFVFSTFVCGSRKSQRVAGAGEMKFLLWEECWRITDVSMEGIV